MRRRITAALDSGERPTLRGNILKLGNVVLQRADGRDAPALAEVQQQMAARDLPTGAAFDSFQPSAVRRGTRTYATDTAGQERMITRQVRGENRVTQAGRRFYRQSYTRYIVHVPTYMFRRSTGSRFREDYYDITGEHLGMDVELNVRGTEQEQLNQVRQAYRGWLENNGTRGFEEEGLPRTRLPMVIPCL